MGAEAQRRRGPSPINGVELMGLLANLEWKV